MGKGKSVINKGIKIFLIMGFSLLVACGSKQPSNKVKAGAIIGAIGGAGVGAVSSSAAIGATAVGGGTIGALIGGMSGPKLPPMRRLQEAGVQVVTIGEQIKLILLTDCFFKFNTSVLKPERYVTLNDIALLLNYYAETPITIAGYGDHIGSDRANRKLSQHRAERILSYFWQKDVKQERMYAVGYGRDKPVASNRTVLGGAMNRRIEIDLRKGEQA